MNENERPTLRIPLIAIQEAAKRQAEQRAIRRARALDHQRRTMPLPDDRPTVPLRKQGGNEEGEAEREPRFDSREDYDHHFAYDRENDR